MIRRKEVITPTTRYQSLSNLTKFSCYIQHIVRTTRTQDTGDITEDVEASVGCRVYQCKAPISANGQPGDERECSSDEVLYMHKHNWKTV